MSITATELKNRLGRYLNAAETQPVIISKSGRAKSVLMSFEKYERFLALEDAYWGEKAKQAESEGFLSEEEVSDLLTKVSA